MNKPVTSNDIHAVQNRARCIYTESQVESALDLLAQDIDAELADQDPILLCVMNGGLIFSGKLLTRLNFPLQLDYLHATRYRGEVLGADLQWKQRPITEIKGRTVLILDDILDEGLTLEKIIGFCKDSQASRVYSAVLIEKHHNHKLSTVKADFVGLQAEDNYLFGYGMDYKGYLRNAAGIFAVSNSDLG